MIRDRRHVYNEPALAFIGFRTRIIHMLHFFRPESKFFTRSLLIAALLCLPFTVAAKQYKAAEIYTLASYGPYGKYVMRVRAAKGSGLISAFFLWKDGSEIPGNFWEEVDIEIFGKNNVESWQSNIITGLTPAKTMSEEVHDAGSSLGEGYHTFTIEWSPGSVSWSVDGNPPVRTTNGGQANDLASVSQLRFNLWAAESVSWVGPWDDDILPRYMYVDWVAYYPWSGTAFEADPEWRDDFDSFDESRWGKANWSFDGNRVDFLPANAYTQGGYLVLRITDENPNEGDSSDYDSGSDSGGGYSSGGGGCPWIVMGALSLFLARRKKS
jgi:beta-glucanase (GH16 family)